MHISWFDIGLGTFISLILLIIILKNFISLAGTILNRDPEYRKYNAPYKLFILIIFVVVFTIPAYFESRLQLANARATLITRQITGNNQVYARCQRDVTNMFDMRNISFAGWVEGGQDVKKANLNPWTCNNFLSWTLSDKQYATDHQIFALHIVIHEAVHLTGEFNEANTEYKASEIFQDIAIAMGASPSEALRMNTFHKQEINPKMPQQYRVDFAAKDREKQAAKEAEETSVKTQTKD